MSRFRSSLLMNTSWTVCLGAASLLALSGCTSVKVKLGWKVYLAKTPIASIAASLPKGPGIHPTASEFLDDAVMRDGFADHAVGSW